MRQRKLKDLDERLKVYEEYILTPPFKKEKILEGKEKTFLEIGCGKGDFIIGRGKNEDAFFLGIEGQPSVMVVAAAKVHKEGLKNIQFINGYLFNIEDWFEKESIDGIYLNFSDPWPKKKHAKRRLNHKDFLKGYFNVLKKDGFLEIKTDNDNLFEFGITQIKELGYNICRCTNDIHNSEFVEDNIMTEYEKKFRGMGKNINYLKVVKGDR